MLQVYLNLKHFPTPFLEGWRKTRKRNFPLLAFALLIKRTCCLAHLARTLPFEILAQSKVNRLFRFIDNEKAILPDDFFAKMGSWLLSLFDHSNWWMKREREWKQIKSVRLKGREIWWQEVLISKNELIKLNFLLFWEEGRGDGWYLATNLSSAREAKRSYRFRMKIEECFRDKKSKMKVKQLWRWRDREHVYRMLLMVAFVLLFLFWLYQRRVGRGWRKRQEIWGKLSYVSLALEWVDGHLVFALFPKELLCKGVVKKHEIKTDYPTGTIPDTTD